MIGLRLRRQEATQTLAEEEGFEPPVGLPTTVFKTAAFNHSATPPGMWGPEGSGSAEA